MIYLAQGGYLLLILLTGGRESPVSETLGSSHSLLPRFPAARDGRS